MTVKCDGRFRPGAGTAQTIVRESMNDITGT